MLGHFYGSFLDVLNFCFFFQVLFGIFCFKFSKDFLSSFFFWQIQVRDWPFAGLVNHHGLF